MSAELTIMTPFSGTFDAVKSIWPQAIHAIGGPADTRLVLLDNSTGAVDVAGLAKLFDYQHLIVTYDKKPKGNSHVITQHMVELWKLMLGQVETPYVFSLEHDVLPPAGTYERLKNALKYNPKIGGVGLLLRARRGRYAMAYPLVSLDPFVVGRLNQGPCTLDQAALVPVGSMHVGCTLFRLEALKHVTPRQLFRGCCSHEHAIWYDIQKAGYEVWQDGNPPRAQHYITKDRAL